VTEAKRTGSSKGSFSESAGEFFLGGLIDSETREPTDETLSYPARRFTTHGVIVGMTGSGKTGLGMVLLEEALLSGVPALILDPKGDMGNLLLNFPELQGSDFKPWIDEAEASRKGRTPEEHAEATAAMWKGGLEGWGIEGERLQRLKDAAEFSIYTPGSTAGTPMNVVGSLAAPGVNFDDHAETLRDEIEGFVTSLLTLAGVKSDPVVGPESVLLSTLIEYGWRNGDDLDLATLIGQVQKPPMRKLGVFEMDLFFPPADRMKLAMRLNGLVASPSFAPWMEGASLDAEGLLYTADGKPKASIIYMAHLSDEERQFVVTLLLSKMITWMRSQGGTSDLRALIYMDEVFGFCPPTAAPPSKKPILTILKQARAHGLGMILSTQNPVDLDYKAMSNAGTWMVGRLQTERDKARILEALRSASGGTDVGKYDSLIGGLDKRQFVLQTAKDSTPRVFGTRWAMSYLRGAITRDEIKLLTEDTGGALGGQAPTERGTPVSAEASESSQPAVSLNPPSATTGPALADDETLIAPIVSDSVSVRYLEAGAPWARDLGIRSGGTRLRAGLAARVRMVFDDRHAGVDHREEWEAVMFPIPERFDADAVRPVDFDDRDWEDQPPEGARYVLPEADVDKASFFRDVKRELVEHLLSRRSVTVFKNEGLKLYSRVGESERDFLRRCEDVAEDRADEAVAKLKDKFEARIRRVEGQVSGAERRVRELEVDVSGRKQQEFVSVAGDLFAVFIGGRKRSRALSGVASRRSQTRRTQERLRSAEEKVQDKVRDLEDLEADLGRAIEDIVRDWDDKAQGFSSMDIGLEKTDIRVEDLVLFWAPVG